MDRQSILREYEIDVDYETHLQETKNSLAIESKKTIERIDNQRQQILEELFSKLQRHEQLLIRIKDDCRQAEILLKRNGENSNRREELMNSYRDAFDAEKLRFSIVFDDEIQIVISFYEKVEKDLTGSNWNVYGTLLCLQRRDEELNLCHEMMAYCRMWAKLLLKKDFYADVRAERFHFDLDKY
jgi:hypothetical protein